MKEVPYTTPAERQQLIAQNQALGLRLLADWTHKKEMVLIFDTDWPGLWAFAASPTEKLQILGRMLGLES